jgi:hypothetical protein
MQGYCHKQTAGVSVVQYNYQYNEKNSRLGTTTPTGKKRKERKKRK